MVISNLLAQTVGALLLIALAHGQQFQFQPLPGCQTDALLAGHAYMPHPNYCELFLQCDSGNNRHTQWCPEGLLYNAHLTTCVAPQMANCENWKCGPGFPTRYPSPCAWRYWECSGSGFEMKNCSANEVFDNLSGNCVVGYRKNEPECERSSEQTSYPCINFPSDDGDICKYKVVWGGIVNTMQCGAGTSFNMTACQCSTLTDSCPRVAHDSIKQNKEPDSSCRASFRIDCDKVKMDGSLQAYSDKLGNGNVELNDTVTSTGLQVMNGFCVINTSPASGSPGYAYIWSFNNNELSPNTIFSIIFKANQETFNPIILLSNTFGQYCSATYEITATYVGGNYNVNFFATGKPINARTAAEQRSGTVSASIFANLGEFIQVIGIFDGSASLQLVNKGQNAMSSGVPVKSSSTGPLGDKLAPNKCGLTIGKNLNGVFKQFLVREGCSNIYAPGVLNK